MYLLLLIHAEQYTVVVEAEVFDGKKISLS